MDEIVTAKETYCFDYAFNWSRITEPAISPPGVETVFRADYQARKAGTDNYTHRESGVWMLSGYTGLAPYWWETIGYWAEEGSLYFQEQPSSPSGLPVINSRGEMACTGTKKVRWNELTKRWEDQTGVWRSPAWASEWTLVAEEDKPTPVANINFSFFENLQFSDSGDLLFWSSDIIWKHNSSGLRAVALPGQPAPGVAGDAKFTEFAKEAVLGNGGDVVFAATIAGKDVTENNDTGIWKESKGQVSLVAREGDRVPVATGDVYFTGFGAPGINSSGDVVFQAGFSSDRGRGGGIWKQHQGVLQFIVQVGQIVSTERGELSLHSIRTPVINAKGEIAFVAEVGGPLGSGGKIGGGAWEGIWKHSDKGLELIVSGDTPAPGVEGSTFYSFSILLLNNDGYVTFEASFRKRPDTVHGSGIWMQDVAAVHHVVHTGQELEFEPGISKKIDSLWYERPRRSMVLRAGVLMYGGKGDDGLISSVSQGAALVFQAHAADGTYGIFRAGPDITPLLPDLSISAEDISGAQVLEDGKTATLKATVHNIGDAPSGSVPVSLLVNGKPQVTRTIAGITDGFSAEVVLPWDVAWKVEDKLRQDTEIEVVVDPDNRIEEASKENNSARILILGLEKGKKKSGVDGKGFLLCSTGVMPTDTAVAPYAVPIAIWFDDDGTAGAGSRPPTRHYNPIAAYNSVLDDIENDFDNTYEGAQLRNGRDRLDMNKFATAQVLNTVQDYWQSSSGIVLVQRSTQSAIAGAPIASYLNWPMLPTDSASDWKEALAKLIDGLDGKPGVSYVIVIADDENGARDIVSMLKGLELSPKPKKSLFVKCFTVEPVDKNEPAECFREVLSAFGDKPSGIVVTNSQDRSCLAAAPLAAFCKSLILDVRDVVTGAVSYQAQNAIGAVETYYADLEHINSFVSSIIGKEGDEDTHNIIGFIRDMATEPIVHLVGTPQWLPFGIKKEPLGFDRPQHRTDLDKDWIATDLRYYDAHPSIVPGGRIPLEDSDNLDYMAMALQFAELPVGQRGIRNGWENNILGASTYSHDGKHCWAHNEWWWLDTVVYLLRDLSQNKPGMRIIQLYEDVSAHGGGWGHAGNDWNRSWYRFDREARESVSEAPLFWYTGPTDAIPHPAPIGNRGDFEDNDHDGFVDEEVWDGCDNDGDGRIDEDCSYYVLMEVEEVYNEVLGPGGNADVDPGPLLLDLIDTNLSQELPKQGLIIYYSHAWTDRWVMQNLKGPTDNRTNNQVTLNWFEVPRPMSPSLVVAGACGSGRIWEPNCIALQFLNQGSLAYIGATALGYVGAIDNFLQEMFNQVAAGRLGIGTAFKSAIDNLNDGCLWSFGDPEYFNRYLDKTRYEFTLFGLGSTEVDPGGDGEERVTYGAPVYNSGTGTWSVDITFDIPTPTEMKDAAGNVIQVLLPRDLLTYFSETADHPALRLLPFNYHLPVGGSLVDVSLAGATVYRDYNLSLYNVTDRPMWPPPDMEEELSVPVEEEPQLYQGPLYPDVLFVHDAKHDSLTNSHRVFGSVAAFQVDGTIPKTTVYDSIVLRVTYKAPLGLTETHIVDGTSLAVEATIVSTDGKQHQVLPTLRVETVGGILYKEVSGQELSVGATPVKVQFNVSDIQLAGYVGRVSLTEGGAPVGVTTFVVTPPSDVNTDGRVDLLDLDLVAAAFNSRPGTPSWNPAADVNKDGTVDVCDLVVVGTAFGWEQP
jgi:hypothetical protein